MERLTEKYGEKYLADVYDDEEDDGGLLSPTVFDVAKVEELIQKLGRYEDLEEQGLLLKLPCKIGTKVYYVQKCLAPSCKTCLGFTRVNNCYCEFKSRIFEQEFDFRHLKAFGKTVFLTQAEAEEALKRMED